MESHRVQRALAWLPVVIHYGGVAGILFTAVFWALTGRLEPLFLGTFGAMMGLGEAGKFLRDLTQPPSGPSTGDELDETAMHERIKRRRERAER